MLTVTVEEFSDFMMRVGSLPGILVKRDNVLVYRLSSEAIIDILYFMPDDVEDSLNEILMGEGLTIDECNQIYPDIISSVKELKTHDVHPPEDIDNDCIKVNSRQTEKSIDKSYCTCYNKPTPWWKRMFGF